MVLHVALLGESDAAQLTLEGLLPRVFDHMDLQSALLIEGLVTLIALEGTLAWRHTRQMGLNLVFHNYYFHFSSSD